MDWLLRTPQNHSTFGRLGYTNSDGYHINKNCNEALESILYNILNEDKYLRTYRRSISFGQNINKDLLPLLLNTEDDKTIELVISILVNLTIPVECLLAVEVISKTDYGRHTVFEINNLLTTAKTAFSDQRATKVILTFLKKNLDNGQKPKLTAQQCTNIGNNLLLLRNILHIPEESSALSPNSPSHVVQNQILYNIFTQGIDKILMKLLTVPEAVNWGVTLVQLIALLYKDQHVVTLHKLLNHWLEASLSESSEDNESNTSPLNRGSGSENSSPMLTSTSDSSDTGVTGKSNDDPNSVNNGWSAMENKPNHNATDVFKVPATVEKNPKSMKKPDVTEKTDVQTEVAEKNKVKGTTAEVTKSKTETNESEIKKPIISANSDCGYGTQIENQEAISTSSNEDDQPANKPTHQKPHNPKIKANTKVRTGVSLQEKKRKKLAKRGKSNKINIQGLLHKIPTDDDISDILKEFTVDFLLKGYNSLVKMLHGQILENLKLEIDISHFFWLVTYFLKFATQIELDLKYVSSVLSYDLISYMTAEGVNLCEQFEIAIKQEGSNLKPCIRRMHLVVTAIREYVQAIDAYKKFSHINSEDHDSLVALHIKMCETEELRSLLVLLLRYYNPKYHNKQYLQDLIVTNHTLLIFLENGIQLLDNKGSMNMKDHIKQFASADIMYQYGLLLEDYMINGEYVNDCIFTLMHHVGGELDSLICLFQPKILKTFTCIWRSEFEICEDWSDLVEHVINTFIQKPQTLHSPINDCFDSKIMDDNAIFAKPLDVITEEEPQNDEKGDEEKDPTKEDGSGSVASEDRWTQDELSSLNWKYMNCSTSPDVVSEIIKLFKEDGVIKTRDSVIRELYKSKLINKEEYELKSKTESEESTKKIQAEMKKEAIENLCKELKLEGKAKFLDWVQKVLLETCFVKIYLEKKTADCQEMTMQEKVTNFDFFKKRDDHAVLLISPVTYHSLIHDQSVPLVPWNCEQGTIYNDSKFLHLLEKLGFHMPADTGKEFIRIPHFWTADLLYEIARKIAPIDNTKLKFSLSDMLDCGERTQQNVTKDIFKSPMAKNFYQKHKQNSFATMFNYTPTPASSLPSDEGIVAESSRKDWLELVQKSQDRNLKLSFSSSAIIKEMETDIDIKPPKEDVSTSKRPKRGSFCVMATKPLILPVVISPDSSLYSANIPEPELFKTFCETSSVASDLTRMYVSDEEDKSNVSARRAAKASAGRAHDRGQVNPDGKTPEKRPRIK